MPPQRRFHFWMTYVNGKGTRYGASLDNGTSIHLRGSDAGVRVTPHGAGGNCGPGPAHTDTFTVAMTRGDGDDSEPVILGTVTSTPDGPRWEPANPPVQLDDVRELLLSLGWDHPLGPGLNGEDYLSRLTSAVFRDSR